MTTNIDREFAEFLLQAIDDPQKYGVHQLFNDWWRYAAEDVKEKYVDDFRSNPQHRAFVAGDYYAEPLSISELAEHSKTTLGGQYHDFIVHNGLEEKIAMNYRLFHEHLESQGVLKGMPGEIRYAILRGFQIHDFLHVLTGYDSSPRSEIALQAFSLAQLKFPYFAMWMTVSTARMTFIDPNMIVPTMDAITEGWQYGRQVKNLSFERWEERLAEPIADVRREHRIDPEGKLRIAA
ncbi:MAG: Coq4 family protein [Pseudomonadales bacterium]